MFNRALRPRLDTLVLLVTVGLVVTAVANAPAPAAAPNPALSAGAPVRATDPTPLTVHEWGTFTSIAAAGGTALQWTPLNGQDDLPCFVNRVKFGPKWTLRGTVRMETPVLYFYSPNDLTVDVKVTFNQGVITEWFPEAAVQPFQIPLTPADGNRSLASYTGTAAWTGVKIRPGAAPQFPHEGRPSHYYPARETDAAPVQVGRSVERFLFYRGVGQFAAPINAVVEPDGRLVLSVPSGAPLGDIVAFDNRGGNVRYLARRETGSHATIDLKRLEQGTHESLNSHLEGVLTAHGLYPKEARAMIATWRDTWFEDGVRLFYIAPQPTVDAVLPLDITPRPAAVARVFVGRIELMTRETFADVKDALMRNDQAALAKYGRFLEPFMERAFAESSDADRNAMEIARQVVYRNWMPPLSACR